MNEVELLKMGNEELRKEIEKVRYILGKENEQLKQTAKRMAEHINRLDKYNYICKNVSLEDCNLLGMNCVNCITKYFEEFENDG